MLGLEKIGHLQSQLEALARTVDSLEAEVLVIKRDILKLQKELKK